MQANDIDDLRSALAYLESKGEVIEPYQQAIDPRFGISTHYTDSYASVPATSRNIDEPMVFYNNVVGYSIPVLMGLFGSRSRNQSMLIGEASSVIPSILKAVEQPCPAEKSYRPLCKQNMITDRIDLQKTIPILTLSKKDAGPYITLGLVYAIDPENGEKNLSIHRICIQGPDVISIWMNPGGHLESIYRTAVKKGLNLPISINIGVDPAIYLLSCLSEPIVKKGDFELDIVGGLRKKPVAIADCSAVSAECIANAEIVLEAEIRCEKINENGKDPYGYSMPEFLGYAGKAKRNIPIAKVKAIANRHNPIYQSLLGPGYEQSQLLSIASEANVQKLIKDELQFEMEDVYYSSAGGGLFLLFLKMKKRCDQHDQLANDAAKIALEHFRFLKHVFIFDEDIDIHCYQDVFWAMTTRFQADLDLTLLPDQSPLPMDPSQSFEYLNNSSNPETSTRAIFDCSVPWKMKPRFRRWFDETGSQQDNPER